MEKQVLCRKDAMWRWKWRLHQLAHETKFPWLPDVSNRRRGMMPWELGSRRTNKSVGQLIGTKCSREKEYSEEQGLLTKYSNGSYYSWEIFFNSMFPLYDLLSFTSPPCFLKPHCKDLPVALYNRGKMTGQRRDITSRLKTGKDWERHWAGRRWK